MENLLSDMAVNESFVFKLLDRIHDFNIKTIEQLLKYDIDCIHINDDYGQQVGLIMGPALWRKYFKPYLKEAVAKIKTGGKYVRLHSCGDLSEIMTDIVELGIDILNPFQPEAMDVYKIKREYGMYITFDGGVSEQSIMARGTPDDVERETMEKMKFLGKGGGYIVGPSQGITRDVPVENIDRFIKVVTSQ
jgi:uroporphyrinogen decarboxylase